MKDTAGEHAALLEYMSWASHMAHGPGYGDSRRQFYLDLGDTVLEDLEESAVEEEHNELLASAIQVGQFEFRSLDNNGPTTTMGKNMKRGVEYFKRRFVGDWGAEVREKYGHPVPADIVEDPLATFEHQWLDEDDGGILMLRSNMKKGNDILAAYREKEVQEKYGHLRPLLEEGKWEEMHRANSDCDDW